MSAWMHRVLASLVLVSSAHAEEAFNQAAHRTKITIANSADGVTCPIAVESKFAARVGEGGYSVGPYYLQNFRGARKGDDPGWLSAALELSAEKSADVDALKRGIKLSFRWACVSSTPAGLKSASFFGLYDEVHRSWSIDFAALDLLGANLERERAAFKLSTIEAKNSVGATITEDDLIGEPGKRVRRFSFCLRKPPVALCGSSEQVKRLADAKSDLEPYALEVIRSIEFLEPTEQLPQAPIKRSTCTIGDAWPTRFASVQFNKFHHQHSGSSVDTPGRPCPSTSPPCSSP